MKAREQLQEEYEDALFALMMYDVAEIEGRRAWEENERLMNDPEAQIPDELTQKCVKLIDRHFLRRKILRNIKRVILATAILLLSGGSLILLCRFFSLP